jgi:predicted nucleic acid-binding protein
MRVEAMRACARYGADYAQQARLGLSSVSLLPMDEAILAVAGDLEPSGLSSLDAIHLATALSIREDLGIFLVYDGRLAEAARAHGFAVSAPA